MVTTDAAARAALHEFLKYQITEHKTGDPLDRQPTEVSPKALADATGVSTDTLRHYERLGLLPGVTRTRSGYRRYPPALVDRVRVIQRALVVGFSLRELASVLRLARARRSALSARSGPRRRAFARR